MKLLHGERKQLTIHKLAFKSPETKDFKLKYIFVMWIWRSTDRIDPVLHFYTLIMNYQKENSRK